MFPLFVTWFMNDVVNPPLYHLISSFTEVLYFVILVSYSSWPNLIKMKVHYHDDHYGGADHDTSRDIFVLCHAIYIKKMRRLELGKMKTSKTQRLHVTVTSIFNALSVFHRNYICRNTCIYSMYLFFTALESKKRAFFNVAVKLVCVCIIHFRTKAEFQ